MYEDIKVCNEVFNYLYACLRESFDVSSRTGIYSFTLRLHGNAEDQVYSVQTKDNEPRTISLHLSSLLQKIETEMMTNINLFYYLSDLDENGERVLTMELDQNKNNKYMPTAPSSFGR